MLSIEALWSRLGALPAGFRIGLLLMALAAVIDITVNLLGSSHHGMHQHGFDVGLLGHLLAIAGMVIAWTGVIASGARRPGRGSAADSWRSSHDATR